MSRTVMGAALTPTLYLSRASSFLKRNYISNCETITATELLRGAAVSSIALGSSPSSLITSIASSISVLWLLVLVKFEGS
jgi:hypothetical protein